MVIWQAVEGVLSLFVMGVIGFILARKGWFPPDTRVLLPKLVTYIALPPFLMCSLLSTFSDGSLGDLFRGAMIPLLSMIACFIISILLARVFHVDKRHTGLFTVSFTTSNTLFIGVPVNMALFGEAAMPYVLGYFFANTLFFWTVGNYCISRDNQRSTVRPLGLHAFKQIFSPPLLGSLAAVALIVTGIRLPDFVMVTAKYVGGMTTPLAIIFIGVILQGLDCRKIHIDRDIILVLVGRFIVSPLSIVLITAVFPIPPLMRNVFIIQSSLPVVMQVAILAGFYHIDTRYASLAVSISVLLSLLIIPFYRLLLV